MLVPLLSALLRFTSEQLLFLHGPDTRLAKPGHRADDVGAWTPRDVTASRRGGYKPAEPV